MDQSKANERLVSEREAAAYLGISRITLLRARQAGRVRFFRIGTAVRYSLDQLQEFLTTCERNGVEARVRET